MVHRTVNTAHAAVNPVALKRGPGRRGAGYHAVFCSKHQFAVRSDINQKRQLLQLFPMHREHTPDGV